MVSHPNVNMYRPSLHASGLEAKERVDLALRKQFDAPGDRFVRKRAGPCCAADGRWGFAPRLDYAA